MIVFCHVSGSSLKVIFIVLIHYHKIILKSYNTFFLAFLTTKIIIKVLYGLREFTTKMKNRYHLGLPDKNRAIKGLKILDLKPLDLLNGVAL